MRNRFVVSACLLAGMAAFSGGCLAQHWRDGREPFRFDPRYRHNHYYPAPGYAVAVLPSGSLSVAFGTGRFFFQSGVWWRPVRGQYVVVTPPVGIVVPMLPPDCVTLWIGGAPYYYANGVYYAVSPGQGYVVVNQPAGAEVAEPAQAVPAPVPTPVPVPVPAPMPVAKTPRVPVIYPRNGQSAAQTEADKQECNRWATTQAAALADGEVFQRAVEACMDAHGYTMR